MDLREYKLILVQLAANFPRDNVPASSLDQLAHRLSDVRVDHLQRAADLAMRHFDRFPTEAQIRETALAIRQRESDRSGLPEPEPNAVPMPGWFRKQLDEFKEKTKLP